jgi:hypothetical protein
LSGWTSVRRTRTEDLHQVDDDADSGCLRFVTTPREQVGRFARGAHGT